MTLRHEFPCKQHADFRAARYQRKHINLLLLDNCEEYNRTYGSDGRPQDHASLETALKRASTSRQLRSKCSIAAVSLTKRTKNLWQSASVEAGQEAADLTKQVGSKRTPTGTFFGLANPGLARPAPAADSVPNMRRENLTQIVLGIGKGVPAETEASSAACAATREENFKLTPSDQSAKPWIMPHLMSDRSEGVKTAKAINSRRNPNGGFANFDLAKAPK